MIDLESQTRLVVTAEGLDCTLTLWYPAGAPDGTQPVRLTGEYQSLDGGGTFDVNSADELPWVVSDGDW